MIARTLLRLLALIYIVRFAFPALTGASSAVVFGEPWLLDGQAVSPLLDSGASFATDGTKRNAASRMCPRRSYFNVSSAPAAASISRSWAFDWNVACSIDTRRSPGRRPATAAGVPGMTRVKMTDPGSAASALQEIPMRNGRPCNGTSAVWGSVASPR